MNSKELKRLLTWVYLLIIQKKYDDVIIFLEHWLEIKKAESPTDSTR